MDSQVLLLALKSSILTHRLLFSGMENSTDILEKTSAFVLDLLRTKLPSRLLYHNPSHSEEVAQDCRTLALAAGLNPEEVEIVQLAGWFHDTGYIDSTDGHEERGVELMEEFLQQSHYPAARRALIAGCIRATKMPQSPHSPLEEIVCDADLLNFGTDSFFEKNGLIRGELESLNGKRFTDLEWLQRSEQLLDRHHFHASQIERTYGPGREKNLSTIRSMISNISPEKCCVPAMSTGTHASH
jgi:predicted metal-dependent HD superfamily phosphohydrolase